MPQSLIRNYIHITFSTKHRQNLIEKNFEDALYQYMAGICKNLACQPIKIGGYLNHVHILCNLSQKIALMKLLEEVKSHSSLWIKKESPNFYWQNGYGAFSVNPKDVDRVISYIENQRKHHQKKTFEEEYRMFLKRYKIDFDERYVWD